MKITKQKLMQIITEELNEVAGLAGGDMEGESSLDIGAEEEVEEQSPDVERIISLIPKIKTPEDFEKTLEAILNHEITDTGGKDRILLDLKKKL